MRSEKDREEHAIVVRRIERTLHPHALWVTATPEPTLVKIANIQHLATPIRAQLAQPLAVIELLGLMHPTPRWGRAAGARAAADPGAGGTRPRLVRRTGRLDRRRERRRVLRRAALRTARGRLARCYAGVGVVRDSDPAAELAETEIKLQALLPLLAG